MTPAQVEHIMELVDEAISRAFERNLAGAIRLKTEVEAALRDAPQAEGWVMVPVEPTEAMGVAYLEGAKLHAAEGSGDRMRFSWGGYRAMLAARPSAPTAVEPPVIDKAELKRLVSLVFGDEFQIVRQSVEPDERDTERMDWLETMTVNVRTHLRYGSHNLFWASPEDRDGDPPGPSDLRKQIDAARASKGTK